MERSPEKPVTESGSVQAMSDEALMALIARRDRTAFGEMYNRHAPRLLGYLLRRLRHGSDAEDVLQETFWQVWSKAADYDARRSGPLLWLLLIARSRSIDLLRKQETARTHTRHESVHAQNDSVSLEVKELTERAGHALSRLPEDRRAAIGMAFYLGWTHERIAREQNVPLGTIKTWIRRGMHELREILSEPESESRL